MPSSPLTQPHDSVVWPIRPAYADRPGPSRKEVRGPRWPGGAWFEGMRPGGKEYADVQLACDYRRPWPGILVCEEGLDPQEVVVIDGVPITVPVRSVVYLMRYATSLRAAVRAFDMAAYHDLVSLDEVWAYIDCHHAWTGIPRAREAFRHCDENAWSPTEADMRMTWSVDAGLPRPLTNVPVFTLDGRHIGTPDLIDPHAGVYGEYDGGLHLAGEQRSRDIRRAAHLPASGRRWTVVPPSWWVETRTVAQRRALTEDQRQRFLAIRRTVA